MSLNKLRMLSQNKNNLITKKKKEVIDNKEETFCDMPSIDESLLLLKNMLATKRTVKRNIEQKIPPKKQPHTYLKASAKTQHVKSKNTEIKEKKRVILINGHVLNRKKN